MEPRPNVEKKPQPHSEPSTPLSEGRQKNRFFIERLEERIAPARDKGTGGSGTPPTWGF
jgi:hypothetical protein